MEQSSVSPSPVAQATKTCLTAFESLQTILVTQPSPDALIFEADVSDGLTRFRVWAGNIGAWHFFPEARSVDFRLRAAPEVSERLADILGQLTEVLDESCAILSGVRQDQSLEEDTVGEDGSEDGASDDPTDESGRPLSELHELIASISSFVTGLLKVSVLVRQATSRDRYARAAASEAQHAHSSDSETLLAELDIRHVKDKFPKLQEKPWLLHRLGLSIAKRRQYLRYARDHHERLSQQPKEIVVLQGRDTDRTRSVYTHAYTHENRSIATGPTLAQTTASTLQPGNITATALQHLQLEDGDDAMSYASSFATFRPNKNDANELQVVPLSVYSKEGEPFECPYCWGMIQMKNQGNWIKHVFHDLRAYVCTFEDCTTGLYESRETWFQHEMEHHRRSWNCQSCDHKIFNTPRDLQQHLQKAHFPKTLPSEAMKAILEASSRPLPSVSASAACPFCDELTIPLNDDVDFQSSGTLVLSLKDIRRHLAMHHEQLALSALPPFYGENDDIDDDKDDHDSDDEAVSIASSDDSRVASTSEDNSSEKFTNAEFNEPRAPSSSGIPVDLNNSGHADAEPLIRRYMQVRIIAALNLLKQDPFRYPNPYAVLRVDQSQKLVTKTENSTVYPVWGKGVFITATVATTIEIQIYDRKRWYKAGSHMASFTARISDLIDFGVGGEKHISCQLRQASSTGSTDAGTLGIIIYNYVENAGGPSLSTTRLFSETESLHGNDSEVDLSEDVHNFPRTRRNAITSWMMPGHQYP